MSDEIKIGDLVEVTWETPAGKVKTVRAQVIGLRPKSIRVEFMRSTRSGWWLSQPWRSRDQVKKVERKPGEKTGSESMREIATLFREAYIASKEDDDGLQA